jgi:uncharacterized protein YdaU (DUF1376 family)
MASETDIWYARYTGAYARKTTHLTTWQHGAYTLLLDTYYTRGKALPDDDAWLASVCKATPLEWKRNKATLSEFFTVAGGLWTHERCEREIHEASSKQAGVVARAVAGADARWGKGRHAKAMPNGCLSNAQALPNGCQTDALDHACGMLKNAPSPSPSQIEGGGPPLPELATDAEVFEFCREWPGEPASGTPVMDPEWVMEQVRMLNGRNEWPRNWRRWFIGCWRAEHRSRLTGGAKRGKTEKNAAPKKREPWQVRKDLDALNEVITAHDWMTLSGMPEAERGEGWETIKTNFDRLCAQRKAMRMEVRAGADVEL